jgi:hypothetical protein
MAAPVFACFTRLVGKYWRTSTYGKKTPWKSVFDEIRGVEKLELISRPATCAADVLRQFEAAGYTAKDFKHGMEEVLKWLKKKTWGILFEKNSVFTLAKIF